MPFGTATTIVLLIARHNLPQQLAADLYKLSQPAVSRIWRYLLALIGQVTAMDRKHLAQALQAGVVLIDGTDTANLDLGRTPGTVRYSAPAIFLIAAADSCLCLEEPEGAAVELRRAGVLVISAELTILSVSPVICSPLPALTRSDCVHRWQARTGLWAAMVVAVDTTPTAFWIAQYGIGRSARTATGVRWSSVAVRARGRGAYARRVQATHRVARVTFGSIRMRSCP